MCSRIILSCIVSIGVLAECGMAFGAVSPGPLASGWSNALVDQTTTIQPIWIRDAAKRDAADARWSLLRSTPNVGAGGAVTFEIDLTNCVLTSSATLHTAALESSTASDTEFVRGLSASITAALTTDVGFDRKPAR